MRLDTGVLFGIFISALATSGPDAIGFLPGPGLPDP